MTVPYDRSHYQKAIRQGTRTKRIRHGTGYLLYVIQDYCDFGKPTGACMSHGTLAYEMGLSDRKNIAVMLREAADAGLLEVSEAKVGHTSHYRLLLPRWYGEADELGDIVLRFRVVSDDGE
jgi:hypothetical protein